MPENHVVIFCTVPDPESGERLAKALVEARLAACVNLIPAMTSIYRWQGAVQRANESLLVIKTTAARYEALAARLSELHPYEVPEILALPVTRGAPNYLDWLTENSR